jgi:hypothetical protein
LQLAEVAVNNNHKVLHLTLMVVLVVVFMTHTVERYRLVEVTFRQHLHHKEILVDWVEDLAAVLVVLQVLSLHFLVVLLHQLFQQKHHLQLVLLDCSPLVEEEHLGGIQVDQVAAAEVALVAVDLTLHQQDKELQVVLTLEVEVELDQMGLVLRSVQITLAAVAAVAAVNATPVLVERV